LKDYNRLTRSHTQHITKINNVLLEGLDVEDLDVCQLLNEHGTQFLPVKMSGTAGQGA
jgi:hypothetical protein